VILLVVYGAYIFFQLRTHAEIYNAPSEKTAKRTKSRAKGDTHKGLVAIGALGAGMSSQTAQRELESRGSEEEEEETEQPQLPFVVAVATLVIATVLVALCAEYMVDAISAVTSGNSGISQTFVGLILLPIVGNAAEHATAVTVAVKDKMDLAIGVAVGSSMQIALLVLPLIVVIGWIMGKDDMVLPPPCSIHSQANNGLDSRLWRRIPSCRFVCRRAIGKFWSILWLGIRLTLV
jgi:Ca2+:H+ antiporter